MSYHLKECIEVIDDLMGPSDLHNLPVPFSKADYEMRYWCIWKGLIMSKLWLIILDYCYSFLSSAVSCADLVILCWFTKHFQRRYSMPGPLWRNDSIGMNQTLSNSLSPSRVSVMKVQTVTVQDAKTSWGQELCLICQLQVPRHVAHNDRILNKIILWHVLNRRLDV